MKKINQFLIVFLFCILSQATLDAQSLGLNNSSPNASAILDASSTSQGVLIPRMTSAQRDAIASPANGLLVYVTDLTTGFYYYNGTKWVSMYSPTSTLIRRKIADESVCGSAGSCLQNTGTVLQNDNDLVIPLQANQSYVIDGFLFMIATSNIPDCKFAFTVPAGATIMIGIHGNYGDNNSNIATDVLTSSGQVSSKFPSAGSGKENPVFISGSVIMGATPGNLTLQWSQFANSNTSSTTIRQYSFLRAMLLQ